MRVRDLQFLLCFALRLLPLAAIWIASLGVPAAMAAWFPLFFVFVALPALDRLRGVDASNPDKRKSDRREHSVLLRLQVLAAVPAWFAVLIYAAGEAALSAQSAECFRPVFWAESWP